MREFRCRKCLKEINETPFYEVHEWSYDDHGDLFALNDFYCCRCYKK